MTTIKNRKGLFIVICGPNNIGKSTAIKGVLEQIKLLNIDVINFKYPIYDLKPTGPRLNAYLRLGNPENLNPLDAQKIFAQNRLDYQPTLQKLLNQGKIFIIEDYNNTGRSWGMANGYSVETMDEVNKNQIEPNLTLFLDGEQFLDGIESKHLNETNRELWLKSREAHLFLARRSNSPIIDAHQSREEVVADLMSYIKPLIL